MFRLQSFLENVSNVELSGMDMLRFYFYGT